VLYRATCAYPYTAKIKILINAKNNFFIVIIVLKV
jgi:hypothetical protein